MTNRPDPSDDYGYDLAHEAQEVSDARPPDVGAPRGAGHRVEQDGDLGYDDAHEIPVSDRPYRT